MVFNSSLLQNKLIDFYVIKSGSLKITEESVLLANDVMLSGLTIKMPWYNDKNKIIGVFGYTIVFNRQPMAASIKRLLELGLFTFAPFSENHLPGKNILNTYFTQRETEILHFVIKGQSARSIALILNISRRTVEQHIENMKNKIGVSTKAELIEKLIKYF